MRTKPEATQIAASSKLAVILLILVLPVLAACTNASDSAPFEKLSNLYTAQTEREINLKPTAFDAAQINILNKGELTSEQAIKLTLLNNKSLNSRYHSLGIRQADLIQAGLLKNPVVEFSTLFTKEPTSPNLTLAVISSLSDLIQQPLREDIAKQQFEIEKLQLASEMIAAAARTHRAYITYIYAVNRQSIAARKLGLEKAGTSLAKGLLKAGNISKYDYELHRARVDQARTTELEAEALINETRAALNDAMGLEGRAREHWHTQNYIPNIPRQKMNPAHVKNRALNSSLTIAIAREKLLLFGLENKLQRRKNLLPDLEVGVEYERDDGENQFGPTGALTIPLFDHGQARRLKAFYQLSQLETRLKGAIEKVAAKSSALTSKYNDQTKLRRHYQNKILPGAKRLQQGALENYNAMQQGAFTLLSTKRQNLKHQAALMKLKYESWQTLISLTELIEGHLNDGPSNPDTSTDMNTATFNNQEGH